MNWHRARRRTAGSAIRRSGLLSSQPPRFSPGSGGHLNGQAGMIYFCRARFEMGMAESGWVRRGRTWMRTSEGRVVVEVRPTAISDMALGGSQCAG
jgi:hypothetical protein